MKSVEKTAVEQGKRRVAELERLLKIVRLAKGTSIDSRDCKGKVFFALHGEKADGNDFALNAIEAGAVCAVIDSEKIWNKVKAASGDSANSKSSAHDAADRLFYAENVLETLQTIGHMHRMEFDIPVIGITGTNGKTTTKELMAAALARKFDQKGMPNSATNGVVATIGNLNTEMGVPMTLLRITDKTGVAVIEMGAKKKGDIRALCEIAAPTHGIITNIGVAHIEGFGSREAIVKTKSELYEYVSEHGGTIFINEKDAILKKALKAVTSKYRVKERGPKIVPFGPKNLISEKNRNPDLIGDYNLSNMNAAKAIALEFKVPAKLADQAIREYKPSNMRSQRIESKKTGNHILLDAYNANPSSMPVAIDAFLKDAATRFKSKKGATRAAQPNATAYMILGDMRELGKESDKDHEDVIAYAEKQAKKNGARIIFIGEELNKAIARMEKKAPKKADKDAKAAKQAGQANAMSFFFKTKEDFLKSDILKVLQDKSKPAYIFVKGSRGMKLEDLVEAL